MVLANDTLCIIVAGSHYSPQRRRSACFVNSHACSNDVRSGRAATETWLKLGRIIWKMQDEKREKWHYRSNIKYVLLHNIVILAFCNISVYVHKYTRNHSFQGKRRFGEILDIRLRTRNCYEPNLEASREYCINTITQANTYSITLFVYGKKTNFIPILLRILSRPGKNNFSTF